MTDKEPPERTVTQTRQLISELLQELFVDYRKIMSKWHKYTGQTPQLDSGYIAQHLVSLMTNIRGSGFRGKGLDLADGGEVKSASSVDGIDIPKWNHNFQQPSKVDDWLNIPAVFYVLFDALSRDEMKLRVRVWTAKPQTDEAYRTVLTRWRDTERSSTNFQLHPPVFNESNLATNKCGNLILPLMFQADEDENGKIIIRSFDLSGLPECVLEERKQPGQKRERQRKQKISEFHGPPT